MIYTRDEKTPYVGYPTLTLKKCEGRLRVEEIVTIIYQKYFQGPKRKGNREPDFLEKINGVFICFVATTIRHCLKAWRTGECAERVTEFKYETT